MSNVINLGEHVILNEVKNPEICLFKRSFAFAQDDTLRLILLKLMTLLYE